MEAEARLNEEPPVNSVDWQKRIRKADMAIVKKYILAHIAAIPASHHGLSYEVGAYVTKREVCKMLGLKAIFAAPPFGTAQSRGHWAFTEAQMIYAGFLIEDAANEIRVSHGGEVLRNGELDLGL